MVGCHFAGRGENGSLANWLTRNRISLFQLSLENSG